MSAYTDDDLARVEAVHGPHARRRLVALFDLRQMHLSEFEQ